MVLCTWLKTLNLQEGRDEMSLDLSRLRGRVKDVFGTFENFSEAMGWSERTTSLKLNGKRSWKQQEILKAVALLKLDQKDIIEYFFTQKVQNF